MLALCTYFYDVYLNLNVLHLLICLNIKSSPRDMNPCRRVHSRTLIPLRLTYRYYATLI